RMRQAPSKARTPASTPPPASQGAVRTPSEMWTANREENAVKRIAPSNHSMWGHVSNVPVVRARWKRAPTLFILRFSESSYQAGGGAKRNLRKGRGKVPRGGESTRRAGLVVPLLHHEGVFLPVIAAEHAHGLVADGPEEELHRQVGLRHGGLDGVPG